MDKVFLVVVSDLDGTLLDHETYAVGPAEPGLRLLAREHVPLVLCSSKTRAEIEAVQRVLDIRHPFISENGGALFVPDGCFPPSEGPTRRVGAWQAIEFGRAYGELVSGLRSAAASAGVRVTGFHDMSIEEVADACRLPLLQASLAKLREYDEPFRLAPDDRSRRGRLVRALGEQGLYCTRGARFDHVTGATDKGLALGRLRLLYQQAVDDPVLLVGLGDAPNDLPMLLEVDIPIIVRNPAARATAALRERVPIAPVTDQAGPAGWSEAIRMVVGSILHPGASRWQ